MLLNRHMCVCMCWPVGLMVSGLARRSVLVLVPLEKISTRKDGQAGDEAMPCCSFQKNKASGHSRLFCTYPMSLVMPMCPDGPPETWFVHQLQIPFHELETAVHQLFLGILGFLEPVHLLLLVISRSTAIVMLCCRIDDMMMECVGFGVTTGGGSTQKWWGCKEVQLFI